MNNKLTLLRYPGGKTRAIPSILPYIPIGTTEVCAPFFGGGSLELYLHSKGIKVYGYDWFKPLVNFWQCVHKDRRKLCRLIQSLHNDGISPFLFKCMQENLMDYDEPFKSASVFFVLNRCSFSGTTLNGGQSIGNPRFTQSCIDAITNCISVPAVQQAHFKVSIPKHDCLIYADPPYYIKQTLYGERDKQERFNHILLAKMLNERGNFILSYNNCEEIKLLYSKHNIVERNWKYGIGKKNSSELLIISRDLLSQ